ncbi:MAG: CocE/NonD family hydrolase C-terminal non-catalytic domain-containing protein [Terriglobales bacterium]|jgi:predicted acyl esterase
MEALKAGTKAPDFTLPSTPDQKVSLSEFRELDPSRSTPLRPWHSHARIQKVRPGDIVPVEIEIWPSATLFEAGSTLQLTIQGQDAAGYPAFGHRNLVNRGLHTIFTGGQFDSCLVIPINQSSLLIS